MARLVHREPCEFLPAFVSEGNRQLTARVLQLEKLLAGTKRDAVRTVERADAMAAHMRLLQVEVAFTEARLDGQLRELDSEQHLERLGYHEMGRLSQWVETQKAERAAMAARMIKLQAEHMGRSNLVDGFRAKMKWTAEEMRQWAEVCQQREEESLALAAHKHRDDKHIRELTQLLERTAKAAGAGRARYEEEANTTATLRVGLEVAADDFRRLHLERQAMGTQWQETLAALHRRDQAIRDASEAYAAQKAALEDRRAANAEQAAELEAQQLACKQKEAAIVAMEREIARCRQALRGNERALVGALDSMDQLRSALAAASDDLARRQAGTQHAAAVLDRKRAQLEAVREKGAAAAQHAAAQDAQLSTLEGGARRMEDLLLEEQRALAAARRRAAALQEGGFRAAHALHEHRLAHQERAVLVAGTRTQSRNLTHKLRRLDEQAQRQREALYHVEFALVLIRRKLTRAGGQRSDEEARALHARIAELGASLEALRGEQALYTSQIKKTEEELVHARRKDADTARQHAELADELVQLEMEIEGVTRILRATGKAREERLVEKDALALDVRRLREALAAKLEAVFSLGHARLALRSGLQERRTEAQARKDVLSAEVKALREEGHRYALELTERTQRAAVLRAKHAALASQLVGVDGISEERSQAYYTLKAAQEKEALQQERSDLLALVQKGEAEVTGLHKALADTNSSNADMAATYRLADALAAEADAARARLDEAYAQLRAVRSEANALEPAIAAAAGRLANLQAEADGVRAAMRALTADKEAAGKAVLEQRAKQARAAQRVEASRRRLAQQAAPQQRGEGSGPGVHEDGGVPYLDLVEREIRLRLLQEANKVMLQEVAALAVEDEEGEVAMALAAAGLALPVHGAGLGSGRASRSPSGAGSVKSVGSTRSTRSAGSRTAHVQLLQLEI